MWRGCKFKNATSANQGDYTHNSFVACRADRCFCWLDRSFMPYCPCSSSTLKTSIEQEMASSAMDKNGKSSDGKNGNTVASIYLDTVIMLWGILRRKNWTCTHMHGHWLLVILGCFDVKTKHAHRCTAADCSLFWRVIWLWRRKILRIMMSHQVIATSYPDTFWQKKDVTLRIYGVITTYILTEIWCHMK